MVAWLLIIGCVHCCCVTFMVLNCHCALLRKHGHEYQLSRSGLSGVSVALLLSLLQLFAGDILVLL
jgi:hypothetical protein